MEQICSGLFVTVIKESISLFVLLVFMILSYRLVDKYAGEFLGVYTRNGK